MNVRVKNGNLIFRSQAQHYNLSQHIECESKNGSLEEGLFDAEDSFFSYVLTTLTPGEMPSLPKESKSGQRQSLYLIWNQKTLVTDVTRCSFVSWELSPPHVDITSLNNQWVFVREIIAKKSQALPLRHSRGHSRILGHHHLCFFYFNGCLEWLQRKRPA